MLRLVDFSTSPWPPQGEERVGSASVNGGPAEVALQNHLRRLVFLP